MQVWLNTLCNKIHMPEEVKNEMLKVYHEKFKGASYEKYRISAEKLRNKDAWGNGLEELKELLKDDKDGIQILTVMLMEGSNAYKQYQELNINDTVFFDTFSCFSRFVKEYKESYGHYGFDRAFWAVRQLSLLLFRLGELEFEMARCTLKEVPEEDVISVHIPADADIKAPKCSASYEQARTFFAKYFSDFGECRFFCGSWLLSPGLADIMDESSNILQFQNRYAIVAVDEDAEDYKEWVFKKREITFDEMPQHTSLQRKMKAYLLKGGKIGTAAGFFK